MHGKAKQLAADGANYYYSYMTPGNAELRELRRVRHSYASPLHAVLAEKSSCFRLFIS
jgi:hypothetical protein